MRQQREPDWESAPPFGRREMLLRTLGRLHELRPGAATIVETGTSRNGSWSGCSGDGWSTVAFGWYARQTGGRVWTVDVDPGAIEACRRITADYAEHIEYVVGDSVAFLRAWPERCNHGDAEARSRHGGHPGTGEQGNRGTGEAELAGSPSGPSSIVDRPSSSSGPNNTIDLLYLDSLDYLDRAASEAHSLAEARAALPWLAPTCLVLFDDTNACAEGYSGKGALAVPFLLSQGFTVEFAEGGQVLVSRRTRP